MAEIVDPFDTPPQPVKIVDPFDTTSQASSIVDPFDNSSQPVAKTEDEEIAEY